MNGLEDYRASVERLASAQKPGLGVPPYTRFVNRPMGRRLAAAAHVVGLSPDQVTGLSMLASGVGLALLVLVTPSAPLGVLVGLLMVLGYALDSADGQLARLRGGGGPAGEWLDHVSDQARHGAMHACVLVYLFRFLPDLPHLWLLVPLAYGISSSTRFLSQILAEQMRRQMTARQVVAPASASPGLRSPGPRSPDSSSTDPTGDARARLRAWWHLPADPGVLCLAFALSGVPELFFVVYTLLGAINTASAAVSLVRKRAELRALGAQASQPTGVAGEARAASHPDPALSGGGRPGGRGTSGTSAAARRRDRSRRTNQSR